MCTHSRTHCKCVFLCARVCSWPQAHIRLFRLPTSCLHHPCGATTSGERNREASGLHSWQGKWHFFRGVGILQEIHLWASSASSWHHSGRRTLASAGSARSCWLSVPEPSNLHLSANRLYRAKIRVRVSIDDLHARMGLLIASKVMNSPGWIDESRRSLKQTSGNLVKQPSGKDPS